MLWSRPGAKLFFFLGAMLAFMGLGLYFWDLRLEGALVACLGVTLMVIGFSVLRFMILLDMKGVKLTAGGPGK